MSKGLIRSGNRRGVRADKSPAVARKEPQPREPAVCRRCGSTFVRRTWRADRPLTHDLLGRASWTVCPACKELRRAEGYGRVVIRGAYAAAHEEAIRRRIRNVADRARFTQPERRLVSAERRGPVLEVLTTSQKLAHRIVHELKKAFRAAAPTMRGRRPTAACSPPGNANRRPIPRKVIRAAGKTGGRRAPCRVTPLWHAL